MLWLILAPYTNDSTTMMTQLQAVPLHQYKKCFDLGFNAINRQPILSLKTSPIRIISKYGLKMYIVSINQELIFYLRT